MSLSSTLILVVQVLGRVREQIALLVYGATLHRHRRTGRVFILAR
jgi:hypothetical protein